MATDASNHLAGQPESWLGGAAGKMLTGVRFTVRSPLAELRITSGRVTLRLRGPFRVNAPASRLTAGRDELLAVFPFACTPSLFGLSIWMSFWDLGFSRNDGITFYFTSHDKGKVEEILGVLAQQGYPVTPDWRHLSYFERWV